MLRFISFNFSTILIGKCTDPIQEPLTNTLLNIDNSLKEHSVSNFIPNSRTNFIYGFPLVPLVIMVDVDKCLCKPTLPPSGECTGHK